MPNCADTGMCSSPLHNPKLWIVFTPSDRWVAAGIPRYWAGGFKVAA